MKMSYPTLFCSFTSYMPWIKRIFHLLVVDENGYYPTLSNNDDVGVADVGDADRGSSGHVVVEVDTLFKKEENTKEYNKYLHACIAAAHKMRTVTLSLSNSVIFHASSRKQVLRCLPFCLRHLLFGFENENLWVRELIS